jgi:hypothetical protein
MTWGFGGVDNKFLSPCSSNTNQILGLYNEKSIVNVKPEHPLTGHSSGILTFCNKNNSAGFSVEDDGSTRHVSGLSHTLLKGFGYGIEKDIHQVTAQNHFKVIANNPPHYTSKEHFGMFFGSTLEDQSSRTNDTHFPIIFRRFVTQTASDDNWISTCEGSFVPWLGPNNNFNYVEKSKETLFAKIINNGTSRITLETGDLDTFINLRIDDIIENETIQTSGKYGATPALIGNRFSLIINNEGSVDLRTVGKGKTLKNKNTHGFHLTIDSDGNLTIHSKGKITFTHGDSDVNNNSITLDPDKGIDVVANKGFRVNGLELVTSKFLDWFDTHKYNMCLVTAIGGPAPLFDIPTFESGKKLLGGQGGFITDNKNPSAKGIIEDIINFSTI